MVTLNQYSQSQIENMEINTSNLTDLIVLLNNSTEDSVSKQTLRTRISDFMSEIKSELGSDLSLS